MKEKLFYMGLGIIAIGLVTPVMYVSEFLQLVISLIK